MLIKVNFTARTRNTVLESLLLSYLLAGGIISHIPERKTGIAGKFIPNYADIFLD